MASSQKSIRFVEWCAGYGGIHLGLSRVIPNLRLVALSEIEAYACANLVAKMEAGLLDPAPVWTDCKTFPCEQFHGCVDLFAAGYPCQPFSQAGQRKGSDDPRHLWPFVRSGYQRMQPRYVFFENVEGHISLGLSTVLSDLEEDGYTTAWGIFSAAEIGASQVRKRVFILGHAAQFGRGERSEYELWCRRNAVTESGGELEHPLFGRRCDNCPPASESNFNQPQNRILESPNVDVACSSGTRCERNELRETLHRDGHGPQAHGPTPELCGLQLPDTPPPPNDLAAWQRVLQIDPSLEPALCRMAHGDPYRVDRLRLCGNGVLPGVVAKAFVTLFTELTGSPVP